MRIYRADGFTGETINRRVLHINMKQSNGLTAGKQPTKRGASQGKKANSFDAAMDSGAEQQTFSPDEQHCLIAEAAYYRALERSFTPGCETDDWLQAEAEVNQVLHMRNTQPL